MPGKCRSTGGRARVYSVSDRPGALQQAVPFAGLAEALAHSVGESAVLRDGITVMEGALVRRLRSRRAGSPSPYWGLWLENRLGIPVLRGSQLGVRDPARFRQGWETS